MLTVERVTVAAADCTTADVAAKTAFLLSDEGPGWIEEQGLAARFLAEDGEVVDVALAG